ncbi:hypothetical protein OHU34_44345 (plasmid) [Streptomyces sp. NBC_00080]|uniref:hypothetical protein n=1 Tax=Streptomyces sp. NBC_00080 TaxID=2975645 RepID=UPI002F917CEA
MQNREGARAPRLLRAGVFAAVCVVTTALGHAVMSGDVLPWWTLGSALAGTAWGAWWLTGGERGAAAVVGATVVAQGLLHLLFDLAHVFVRGRADLPPVGRAPGMDHGIMFSHSGMSVHMDHSDAGLTLGHAGMPGAPFALLLESVVARQGSGGMYLAHLLAAVVCGLWLCRGEAAAHQVGRALAVVLFAPLRRICRVLAHPALDRRAPSVCAAMTEGETARTAPVLLRHAVVRRGPPSAGLAVVRLSASPLPVVRP